MFQKRLTGLGFKVSLVILIVLVALQWSLYVLNIEGITSGFFFISILIVFLFWAFFIYKDHAKSK
ncbi:hypothetical protein RYX56_08605 [Alkalihalophilus lindianensis]|uniref:Uncharacterized protein n=1 Tax=Alkalihalophilus lindianensis TaxID=1630542 RepID=A0ABU3X983_9BACI|nr:hypothetical protein [Alkalihalophilus lindianensis]MDV2684429.1 hypothetical protein [Alkalihalophilus lindianensis]